VFPNQAAEEAQELSLQETREEVPSVEPAWVSRVLAITDDSSKQVEEARKKSV